MTKKERLEDLGRINIMLKNIIDEELFEHTDSKHGYDTWVTRHHDALEDGEPKGLDNIFRRVRHLREQIEEAYYLSCGDAE